MNNSKFWSSDTYIAQKPIGNLKINFKSLGNVGLLVALPIAALGLLAYVIVIGPSLAVIGKVKVLKRDGALITSALQSRDLVALDTTLTGTDRHLKELAEERDRKFGWAKNTKIFKLSEYYDDSNHFISASYYATEALREVSKVVTPFADAAGLKISAQQATPETKGLMEAFQTWVSIMPQVAGQMDGVIEKVGKIGKEIAQVNTAKYPEKIGKTQVRASLEFAKKTLVNVSNYGPDIKQALTVFPRLLGIGNIEKRYMIIMQNDKEIRPTGGFMTNYATFKIRNALLQSDFSSKDMYSIDKTLDIVDATYDFPDAPPAYMKYLKVERWYARDMNVSPDFVTSMDQLMKFYNMAGRIDPYNIKPVDGIVGIDTHVVRELLDATGPVTVSGITYTKDNVVLELEKIASLEMREQVNRKGVLGKLMQSMLINVFESDKNLWSKLIDTAVSLTVRKHIQAYVFDAEAQALIEKYNFGGRIITDTPGDYSAVISTNLGGDKTNWFTTKKVAHKLTREQDKWVREVKIEYTYKQPAEEFAPFVKRFKDWVRVYAPLGSQVISVEGTEDGTTADQELNKAYFTGYIELGPGETKTLTFKYYLPAGRVNDDKYQLTIQKQAGINSEVHTLNVNGKIQEVILDKDTKLEFRLK